MSKISSQDGAIVEVGAVLGSISQNDIQTSEENKIIKTKPEKKENNVVNLTIERKIPKISEEKIIPEEPLKLNEEPLVLTKEIKEKKSKSIK